MKKALTLKMAAIYIMSSILLAIFIMPLVRATPGTAYSFVFTGRTSAANTISGTHVEAGDEFWFIGTGTFDTSTETASGGGAFSHIKFDGKVHGIGYWKVKEFVSFDSGLLTIIVDATSYHVGEAARKYGKGPNFNTFMLKISSEGFTVWAGPGFVLPIFSIIVSGHTLFHLKR